MLASSLVSHLVERAKVLCAHAPCHSPQALAGDHTRHGMEWPPLEVPALPLLQCHRHCLSPLLLLVLLLGVPEHQKQLLYTVLCVQ